MLQGVIVLQDLILIGRIGPRENACNMVKHIALKQHQFARGKHTGAEWALDSVMDGDKSPVGNFAVWPGGRLMVVVGVQM
jgi:hypothetical protein